MKTGKLNTTEKSKILELFKNKKEIPEIAAEIDRNIDVISKYIDEIRAVFEKEMEEIKPMGVDKSITNKASNQLAQYGLSKHSINQKINKVLRELPAEELKILTAEMLISYCLQLINAGDLMVNKTGGGSQGVVAMTEAASQKGDESKKSEPKQNPHVYKLY